MADTSLPSRGLRTGFGAGALGATLSSGVVPLLFLFYLTEFAHVPPALAGLLLAIPKFTDVVLDPWLGRWSDRWARRTGSRAALLAANALLLPSMLVLLFIPAGGLPLPLRVSVIGVLLVAQSLIFTVFSVAHTAIASDITDTIAGRSTLMSARALGQTFAGLTVSMLAPQLVGAFGSGAGGYLAMACTLAAASALALGLCWLAVRRTPLAVGVETKAAAPLLTALRSTLRNRAFYCVVLILVLLGTSSTALFAALPYANQHLLQAAPEHLSTLLTPIFVALLVGVAAAPALTRRMRPNVVLAAALSTALAGIVWFAAGPRENTSMIAAGVLFGLSCGMLTVLISTLAMEAATHSSSQGESLGLYLGILFSAEKLGQSLGGIVVGFGLEWVGPLQGTPAPEALRRLGLLFVSAPAAALLAALLVLLPFTACTGAHSIKEHNA
ncbi:MFS transporter [Duganella sp. BJB488]|uniref:MFS transporter n=1 Tax=unclassified Duganella TaxID=2636909 RepID=UPI000E34D3F7|nr:MULTISPECIES: MFS transporter [unclassified Duganella]RFP17873.1 MFS transporter [Duganella sp. BJB489]RFP17958.1 MFS transporter [Duganella sp. BJB488]RFP37713.1 MFS transporter [Duganella sp. BJB480]